MGFLTLRPFWVSGGGGGGMGFGFVRCWWNVVARSVIGLMEDD